LGKKTNEEKDGMLHCSFCGKSQREVRKLIAGPAVFICDECIDLCADTMQTEAKPAADKLEEVPVPSEIRDVLDDDVIGQAHAKRVLSVGEVLQGLKRLFLRVHVERPWDLGQMCVL